MKIFSSMLYIILEQQWISLMMMTSCQWSSRSCTILKRIAADSELIIAENALRTSINKEIWIASILSNWEAMRLNFRISHTKEMWDKCKNECQELQSFLHMLILEDVELHAMMSLHLNLITSKEILKMNLTLIKNVLDHDLHDDKDQFYNVLFQM